MSSPERPFYSDEDYFTDEESEESLHGPSDSSFSKLDYSDVKLTKAQKEKLEKKCLALQTIISDTKSALDEVPDCDPESSVYLADPTYDTPPPPPANSYCPYCKKSFPSKQFLTHVQECKLTCKETCPTCLAEEVVLSTHECPESHIVCPFCRKTITTSTSILLHFRDSCEGNAECPSCSGKFLRKELDKHRETCKKGPVELCKDCKMIKLEDHDCPDKQFCSTCGEHKEENHTCQLKCEDCGSVISESEKAHHQKEVCKFREIGCPRCKNTLPVDKIPSEKRLKDHMLNECKRDLCEFCLQPIEKGEMPNHMEICLSKTTICNVKSCEGRLPVGEFRSIHHGKTCPFCPPDTFAEKLKTAASFPNLHTHLETECEHFEVPCPIPDGCKKRIQFSKLESHLQQCKGNLIRCWGENCGKFLHMHKAEDQNHLKQCVALPCIACNYTSVKYQSWDFKNPQYGVGIETIGEHLQRCVNVQGANCSFCGEKNVPDIFFHLTDSCNSFFIKCPIGSSVEPNSNKCKQDVCFKDLPNHYTKCVAIQVNCVFETCRVDKMALSELSDHLNNKCNSFKVKCPMKGCNAKYLKKNEEKHFLNFHCLPRLPPSSWTGAQKGSFRGNDFQLLTAKEKGKFVSSNRVQRKLARLEYVQEQLEQTKMSNNEYQCKCSISLGKQDAHKHVTFECTKTIIPCILQCGVSLTSSDMMNHIRTQCLFAAGSCKNCPKPANWQTSLQSSSLQPDSKFRTTILNFLIQKSKTPDPGQPTKFSAQSQKHISALIQKYAKNDSTKLQQGFSIYYDVLAEVADSFPISKRNEADHAIQCTNNNSVCIYCLTPMSNSKLKEHMTTCEARNSNITCTYCNRSVEKRSLVNHWFFDCTSGFKMNCNLCNESYSLKELSQHRFLGFCPKFKVPCAKCKKDIPSGDIISHITLECELDGNSQTANCSLCNSDVTPYQLCTTKHFFQCKNFKMDCPIPLPRKDSHKCNPLNLCELTEHFLAKPPNAPCPNILVACQYCKKPVERIEFSHHLHHECEENFFECPNAKYGCMVEKPSEPWPKYHYYLINPQKEGPPPSTKRRKLCEDFPYLCEKCSSLISLKDKEDHPKGCTDAIWECGCGKFSGIKAELIKHRDVCEGAKWYIHADATEFIHAPSEKRNHDFFPLHDHTTRSHQGRLVPIEGRTTRAWLTFGISLACEPYIYSCCNRRDGTKDCPYTYCYTCGYRVTTSQYCNTSSSKGRCNTCSIEGDFKTLNVKHGYEPYCPACNKLESQLKTEPCTKYTCIAEGCNKSGVALKNSGCKRYTKDYVNDSKAKEMVALGFFKKERAHEQLKL